ncbi:MAG: hypothetical protein M3Z05_20115 [Gemmatimonadota bacterium]|nr:hypothetical protein [Gemmatimonadota bacterium]
MSDYRIEKVRHRVELTLAAGGHLEGDIFLQAFARFKAGPEEPLDALNDSAQFLPLIMASDELLLVQKSQIAIVTTALPQIDELGEAGLVGMHVELIFANGDVHTGSVFPELRADRPRLVDFLNNSPLRFVPLFTAEHLLLIATAHVAYARPAS